MQLSDVLEEYMPKEPMVKVHRGWCVYFVVMSLPVSLNSTELLIPQEQILK